jgi:hypothetical protein
MDEIKMRLPSLFAFAGMFTLATLFPACDTDTDDGGAGGAAALDASTGGAGGEAATGGAGDGAAAA